MKNAELADIIRALRDEIASLRAEVASLRAEGAGRTTIVIREPSVAPYWWHPNTIWCGTSTSPDWTSAVMS